MPNPLPPTLPLTEQQNPLSLKLDSCSIAEAVQLMHNEEQQVQRAVAEALPAISATIERVVSSFQQGGRLFYLGAGTSGRLGVLDASECPPTFRSDPELVQGLIAGGPRALQQAVEGAEDIESAALEDLQAKGLRAADMLVGIAASGHTPYVRAGLRYAKSLGCQTALIACNRIAQDDPAVDEYIVMPVGPEVVTGSTRLKAGTATKLALNMISTVSMVHMGKVYGNLMVDLQISNAKLKQRALRMLQQLTELDETAAEACLSAAQGEVKTAVLMHHKGLDYPEAKASLAAHGGHLRRALGESEAMSLTGEKA